MKNILCYGDSNTYGLKPDGTGRYDYSLRYPGILQEILGCGYRVIEAGCPGRTTVFEDALRPNRNGLDSISGYLHAHAPLDYILLMLGTSDCKSAYAATCVKIASGLSRIIEKIRQESDPVPHILIISPIYLGENIGAPDFDSDFDRNSAAVSRGLASEFRKVAKRTGSGFLDASSVAWPSSIDQEHLDEEGHACLAAAAAKCILDSFSRPRKHLKTAKPARIRIGM